MQGKYSECRGDLPHAESEKSLAAVLIFCNVVFFLALAGFFVAGSRGGTAARGGAVFSLSFVNSFLFVRGLAAYFPRLCGRFSPFVRKKGIRLAQERAVFCARRMRVCNILSFSVLRNGSNLFGLSDYRSTFSPPTMYVPCGSPLRASVRGTPHRSRMPVRL